MKSDFYVPVFRQVALDNVPLRNGHSFKTLVRNPASGHLTLEQR